MKKLFTFYLAAVSVISAQTQYPPINREIQAGNYSRATVMIDSLLQLKELNLTEANALEFEKDKLHRIRLDFSKTEADILPYIRKYYPSVDKKMLEEWENNRTLESMVIDGKKMYFNRAASNLFLINSEAKSQNAKTEGPAKEVLTDFLKTQVPSIVKNSITTKQQVVNPVDMHIVYTITVKPNVVPDGEIIKCWLPYPREGHQRQSDIKLIAANTEQYSIAGNNNLQRTLYMEKKAVKDEPTVFRIEYSYRAYSEWHNIDSSKVADYDKLSELYSINTAERPPHIVFSKEIRELSDKIVGKETNPYLKAKLIFKWINDNIPWAGAREYSTLDNIPAYSLENRHGDCGIKTLLFMTLARYNGIPTKWQSGWMMHPVEVNLHDWCEAYFEGYGWVPVDQSFGLQNYSDDENIKYFYSNGIDSYRLIVNDDFSKPLSPEKQFPRSETVDFQRGEVEWKGGNLYFNTWSYDMDIKYSEPEAMK
ncbi:MAG: transglutaminase-like domain-containing protein [Ignavibacteriales bacterium]